MRYLTLITLIHDTDSELAKQYANGLKTWWKNLIVPEMLLHVCITGSAESKRNIHRELAEVSEQIKINYECDWQEGSNKPQMLNKAIQLSSSPYVGILPYPAWREPFAVQNQLATLRNNCDFTYGDYVTTDNLNHVFQNVNKQSTLEKTYDIGRGRTKHYYRQANQWGEFIMWKRSLHDHLNFFDESLTHMYEFDWINRLLSIDRLRILKTAGIMGASCNTPTRNLEEEKIITKRFEDEKVPCRIVCFGKEEFWRQ